VRDLFHEGIKLSESLARLPWEAARRVVGGRSETLGKAADLGEQLGTLPFRAANRMFGPEDGAASPAPGGGDGRGAAGTAARPTQAIGMAPAKYRGRIVVLGAGYAGLTCFLELQDNLSREYDLVLVNGDKYHWFTTELHTYVAGEEPEAVRIPLSRVVTRPGRVIVDRVEGIDPERRQVLLAGGGRIDYDILVFALGSDPEYYGLPGVAENSLVVGNWRAATRLRERVMSLLEDAAPCEKRRLVVAGGGLTGVEVAAELAEEYPERAEVTILEAGPEIMAGFAPVLVQTAHEVLAGKGIAIKTGNPIVRVEPNLIAFKDGQTMPFDLLVWSGGVRGSALLGKSGLTTTRKGRGKVDAYLRAEGHEEIYLVGDSAAFMDPATGREVPPTGQAAVQMGRHAGRNILHRLRGRAEEPFVPRSRGAFASLGRKEGVGQMGKEQFTGVPAMVMKNLIEAHHVWETGGGVGPLLGRLLRAPQRYFRSGHPQVRQRVSPPAARPEPGRHVQQ
jgi:NADH:ubiquinone reductase (H+-translocating)